MKLFRLFLPFALCLLPLGNGCAKSPSGGPINTASNRLQVVLSLDKTIDPNFYYGVAFDDVAGDGNGPNAIIGNTLFDIPNRVMDGNWRVFVRYHLNQFEVYYRSDPADYRTERQVLGATPFIGQPQASAGALNFTLNLDAKIDSNTYFFTHTAGAAPALATDRFDINFVSTNTFFTSPQDQRVKPVDAYGPSTTSTPFEFIVASTRRFTVPNEPTGDRNFGVDASFDSVNFGQLDVRQLDLNVTRG